MFSTVFHTQTVRKTRRGKLIQRTTENYIRTDITCGIPSCNSAHCQKFKSSNKSLAAAPNSHYIIPSSQVLIDNVELFKNEEFLNQTRIIFLMTVLKDVKQNAVRVYHEIVEKIIVPGRNCDKCFVFYNENCEFTVSDNPTNLISTAVDWYQNHSEDVSVLYVTDIQKYVEEYFKENAELLDIVSRVTSTTESTENPEEIEFSPYLTREKVQDLLLSKSGVFQSSIRVIKGAKRAFCSVSVEVSRVSKKLLEFVGEENILDGKLSFEVEIGSREDMNRAIDGDIVAVEIHEIPSENVEKTSDKKKKTSIKGRVVSIIERRWRLYCGSLSSTDRSSGHALFIPVDERIPYISIESRQLTALLGKRIIVSIDSWPRTQRNPHGHFVRVLGDIGDKDVETSVILHEYSVPHEEWSDDVVNCCPDPETWSVQPCDFENREDLRDLRICSIDPPGCTDIDDALHHRILENGNFEIGVHIADVSHYVKPGNSLDKEAARRATSVYLVQKRIDMLPARLSTNICSLRSGVERLAFSVIWEMNGRAEIVNVRFTKSVINSKRAFCYADAQKLIDNFDLEKFANSKNPTEDEKIASDVFMLNRVAKILRKRRENAGALSLESGEVKIFLEDEKVNESDDSVKKANSKSIDLEVYESKEANKLVEEFMLLANISVSKRIVEGFPLVSVLRRHPPPLPNRFDSLKVHLNRLGFELDHSSSKALAESLNAAEMPDFPMFNRVLRSLTTRCLSQAVYFLSGQLDYPSYLHYGLATPIYTHFTSPIRRYADLLVHRLLSACIGVEPLSDNMKSVNDVKELVETCNYRSRMAQYAGRASVDLFTVLYFDGKTIETEGLVMETSLKGIEILAPSYGVQGFVGVDDEASTDFNEETMLLKCEFGEFQVFDRVRVRITVEEVRNGKKKLCFTLLATEGPATKKKKT